MQTVLLFALPEEHASFRTATGPWRLTCRTPFKTYRCTTLSHDLVLVETGMGREPLCRALSWLLEHPHPDLIISAGFAGSLSEHLSVGDACLGEAFVCFDEDHEEQWSGEVARAALPDAVSGNRDGLASAMECSPLATFHLKRDSERPRQWLPVAGRHLFHQARIITVTRPRQKASLAHRFADGTSLMDMESYYTVRFCFERRIPVLAIRAVSDGLEDELDFDLGAISDDQGKVRVPRVLASVIRSPRLIKSYYHAWRRSRTAARSLGNFLTRVLALPERDLEDLVRSLSYYAS